MLAELLAHPDVEERCVLRSRFGFLALHGGLEQHTAEIAERASELSDASYYAVVQPDDLKWHVPSHRYDADASPTLRAFLDHVDVAVSVHGYGGLRGTDDRWTTVLLGGSNRTLASTLAGMLRSSLPDYTWIDDLTRIPAHLRGVHPANPVNQPRHGGVQLELPPRVRGFGLYWQDFEGPGYPPHTVALLDALSALPTR
jgi:phage replication-related protein YjqB (UPF0714/DUF867 family)